MAIAMKDLEIRGAGNLLGGEQSGHIADVGFDLYVRLVGEAVAEFRRATPSRSCQRGPDRAAGRRPPAARLHPQRAAAAGDVQAAGRGAHRRGRRPAPRRDASTATASRPSRSPRCCRGAVPGPGPRGRDRRRSRSPGKYVRFAPVELPESRVVRLSGCTRRASSRRRSRRSWCRVRRPPASGRARSPGWPCLNGRGR